ncbi:hypothetical protein F4775DRAFT_550237 [Biscogniauxia sp. FL1348]|nr:hypothetical protein F4775DRAFT_550237 [Biscogniauxia sp. FL1348]
MPSLPSPIPIVLIGLRTEIGRPVSQGLLPEYEVIRFIQSLEAAQADLPYLLAGRAPPAPPTNDVGTHRYGRPARAVLFGRAFTPAQAAELRSKATGAGADLPVAWVVGDPAKKPSGGSGSGSGPPPGYADVAARISKGVLDRWREEGGLKDDIILY